MPERKASAFSILLNLKSGLKSLQVVFSRLGPVDAFTNTPHLQELALKCISGLEIDAPQLLSVGRNHIP